MNGESSEQRQPASKPGRLSGSAAFMMAPMAFGAPLRLWQVLALILRFRKPDMTKWGEKARVMVNV